MIFRSSLIIVEFLSAVIIIILILVIVLPLSRILMLVRIIPRILRILVVNTRRPFLSWKDRVIYFTSCGFLFKGRLLLHIKRHRRIKSCRLCGWRRLKVSNIVFQFWAWMIRLIRTLWLLVTKLVFQRIIRGLIMNDYLLFSSVISLFASFWCTRNHHNVVAKIICWTVW